MSKRTTPSVDDQSTKRLKLELSDEDHKNQDRQIQEAFNFNLFPENFALKYVLALSVTLMAYSDIFMGPIDDLVAKLFKREDAVIVAEECFKSKAWKNWRDLVKREINANRPMENLGSSLMGSEATVSSWDHKFSGESHKALEQTIRNLLFRRVPKLYARIIPIVQSSGTGKSRMVHEMAKYLLVIPINLRPRDNTGFPAADHAVRDYLTEGSPTQQIKKLLIIQFLISLFETTLEYIQNIDQHLSQVTKDVEQNQQLRTLAEKFRFLMTCGQQFDSQGEVRLEFYEKVIKGAKDLNVASMPESSSVGALSASTSFTYARGRTTLDIATNKLLDGISSEEPIVLAFDEVQAITARTDKDTWSAFYSLRQVLNNLTERRIVSVFLSTTAKIHDFFPPSHLDPSQRLQSGDSFLLPPFTALGLDQLCDPILENTHRISQIATIPFMVKFGRPLFASRYEGGDSEIKEKIIVFAATKLLRGRALPQAGVLAEGEKLACLAVRLALEFNATTLVARETELEQVENHMRVCITINPGNETAVTIAPSEPILAEASLLITNHLKLDLPRTLLDLLRGPSLSKGDRGELICLLLWTLARDKTLALTDDARFDVKLVDLLDQLLTENWHQDVHEAFPAHVGKMENAEINLESTFANSRVYFNHFVKISDNDVVNHKFLWRLMTRGAGILCADNQRGIDIIIPFIYDDNSPLGPDNVSAIIVQVKNDRKYASKPNQILFDAMDPYFIHLYNAQKTNPHPVIRMVFALASDSAVVKVVDESKRRKPAARAAKKKLQRSPGLTSYDIWCAETSSKTFRVINSGDEDIYDSLLKIHRKFPAAYNPALGEPPEVAKLKKHMHPGSGVDPCHWSFAPMEDQAKYHGSEFDAETDTGMDTN